MSSRCCPDLKIAVCVLTASFGMGSWIAINGIWVELPILVDQLPEDWNLPSYVSTTVLPANVGPIAITMCSLLKKQPPEKVVIYLMVIAGSAASLLLAFLWRETSYIAGTEHSTALLVLMFLICLVDCTTSVLFLPFMNTFKPQYLTSYYIGEGFSGLIPSFAALAQGVGQVDCMNTSVHNLSTNETDYFIKGVYRSTAFPVNDFFLLVFAMMVACGLSFTMLKYLPYCKREYAQSRETEGDKDPTPFSTDNNELNTGNTVSITQQFVDLTEDLPDTDGRSYKVQLQPVVSNGKGMSRLDYLYFLLLTGWINAVTNGVLPSIQTYACLPYGSEAYHLALTLSNIANPVACFVAFLLPVTSAAVIGLITIVGSGLSMYIMALAIKSPVPPLVDTFLGTALVVGAI